MVEQTHNEKERQTNLHTLTCSVPYSWVRVAEHGRYEAVGAEKKRQKFPSTPEVFHASIGNESARTRQSSLVPLA